MCGGLGEAPNKLLVECNNIHSVLNVVERSLTPPSPGIWGAVEECPSFDRCHCSVFTHRECGPAG